MSKDYIGEFEELVLLTAAILDDNAYGLAVCDEIKTQTGREVTIGAVHATVARLEKKGLVETSLGAPTKSRGGRRKRIIVITSEGKAQLKRSRDTKLHLWNQIPTLSIQSNP